MASADNYLDVFFDLVPTGAALYAPLLDEQGELVDFRFVRLNPAGQRLLGLPAQPPRTLREYYPGSLAAGIFDQYRQAYLTAQTSTYDVRYTADGLDTYFRLVVQRSGELLVVSFRDLHDLPRPAVEQSLRASQAREQAARAEAEAERQRLYQVLMRMPANVALLSGPDHVYTLVNPEYERLFPARTTLGRSIREVIPELEGQGFYESFDRVYKTGKPYYEAETEAWADFAGTGELQRRYYRTSFEPICNAQGQVTEVLNFAIDVTDQVEARQQVEQLNQVAQAARAEAERQRGELERVFEQAPMAIAVYRGPTHTIELANSTVARLWGRQRAQLIGKGLFEALPEVAGLGYEELLDGVLATGEPHVAHAMEAQHDRNGHRETVYWDFVYVPVHAADGSRNGVMVVANEVTAQVLARRQMQQLNQELEAHVQERTRQLEAARAATERQRRQWYELFRQAPAGICVFDGPEWVYEFVNPGYQALFPGRALLGKRLVDALPEVADQPMIDVLRRVYDTGEPFEASEVLVPLARTEGGPVEDIYFDFTYQARYNEAGQINGFITYAYDVTEQVRARHERERQRQQLHRLFLEAPAAICILDGPELVYELVNESYQRLFPGRALQGRPLLEALPELAGQPVWQTLRQVYQTGQVHQALGTHIPVAKYEGGPLEDFYFDYVQQPRYNAAGLVDGVVMFAFDITSQVLARYQVDALNEELAVLNEELTVTNEELNESNAQLKRTNVDLDTFVYTASHDLKAPITNIEGIVLALRETLPPEVQQGLVGHLLELLDKTVARFQVTIGQLTDISRLQLAHTGPAEPVVLAPVVQAVRLDLLPAVAAAGAQLTVEVPAGLVVSFSPANLRSIVYNLLSNAIKYRAPDRLARVHVRAAQAEVGVVLVVQDNGLGMSELQQRQLFGLFQRLHTHVEGTGVGLYITKRLIENAGGTIAVQSQPNEGTTFTVTLPT